MTAARLRTLCAATALPFLLGGCVAAVPVAASAVLAGKAVQKRHDGGERLGQADSTPAGAAMLVPEMKALPPPTGDTGYAAFVSYARDKAAARTPESEGDSVILAPDSRLTDPRFASCGPLAPAVIIDLDPGYATFAPDAPGTAEPGLPGQLASLRAVGVTVMWASLLPVDNAQAVYARLRDTGLDPAGIDRVLLMRPHDERKQTRRLAAARDWCVIAIAGDRDGDFDELFDYLRNPDYAAPLAFLKNAGWFIAPPPIQQTPIKPEKPNP